jgi:hypothetical protein
MCVCVCVCVCVGMQVCMHVCLWGGSRVGKQTSGQKPRAEVIASLPLAWPLQSGGLFLSGPFFLLPHTLHRQPTHLDPPIFLPPTLSGRR